MTRVDFNHFGVPPLAGLCSYEEACKVGYGVDRSVELLKRYHYVKVRLNEILAAHLARTPEWEVKCGFSLHMWLETEHSAALRKRVSEMREPPLHMDKVPDHRLQALFDELIRSEHTLELLAGIYRVVKPEMIRSLKKHLAEMNPLTDQPTCRILKFMLIEEEEMTAWGEQAITGLMKAHVDRETAEAVVSRTAVEVESWICHLRVFLFEAGGFTGDLLRPQDMTAPVPRSDGRPYEMDPIPQRDERFRDNFNQSAAFDAYFRDESLPADERVYALLYNRLREMSVPEWMAPIIYKTKGKPWEYYADMSRQLWDECRHAMLGETGLYQDGMPFYEYPVEMKSSFTLNKDFEPLESHTMLWAIEQSLMPRDTGKRREWMIAKSSDNELAAHFQDYDWADEVLHAQIGRKWLIGEYGSMDKAQEEANQLFPRWWESSKRVASLSEQTPWWPSFLSDIRQRRERIRAGFARAHEAE